MGPVKRQAPFQLILRALWRSEHGVTLIETVLTLALLGVALAALIATLATGLNATQLVEQQSASANLITSQVEEILSRPFGQEPREATRGPSKGVSVVPAAVRDSLDIKRVTVVAHVGEKELQEELIRVTTSKVNTWTGR